MMSDIYATIKHAVISPELEQPIFVGSVSDGSWIDADGESRSFREDTSVGFNPDLAFIIGAHSMCGVIATNQDSLEPLQLEGDQFDASEEWYEPELISGYGGPYIENLVVLTIEQDNAAHWGQVRLYSLTDAKSSQVDMPISSFIDATDEDADYEPPEMDERCAIASNFPMCANG